MFFPTNNRLQTEFLKHIPEALITKHPFIGDARTCYSEWYTGVIHVQFNEPCSPITDDRHVFTASRLIKAA